jgi:hypothetical protein
MVSARLWVAHGSGRTPYDYTAFGFPAEGERFELSRDETAPNGFRD